MTTWGQFLIRWGAPPMATDRNSAPSAVRQGGRLPGKLRDIHLDLGWAARAEGSVLVHFGETRVLCAASVLDRVPEWRRGKGVGWVTAEYGMLPRSTHTRRARERDGAGGRTREIERLIGRSLRSVVNLHALGERTIQLDCDVLQADGGTRTAAVSGGWVALVLAARRLVEAGVLSAMPVRGQVAAVSVGLVDGLRLLDLDYREDAAAQMDLNVVAAPGERVVEVQGTAEGDPVPRSEVDGLISLALEGIGMLHDLQVDALGAMGSAAFPRPGSPRRQEGGGGVST